MDTQDRHEVADYLQNEAANCQDAELGDKLMRTADVLRNKENIPMTTPSDKHPMHPASVRFSAEAMWIGESRFADGHLSSLVNDIASEFAEATNDMCIYLDNLAAVDLEHANVDWRDSMVMNLERDLDHITTLVRNAMTLARNLRLEGETDEG